MDLTYAKLIEVIAVGSPETGVTSQQLWKGLKEQYGIELDEYQRDFFQSLLRSEQRIIQKGTYAAPRFAPTEERNAKALGLSSKVSSEQQQKVLLYVAAA